MLMVFVLYKISKSYKVIKYNSKFWLLKMNCYDIIFNFSMCNELKY